MTEQKKTQMDETVETKLTEQPQAEPVHFIEDLERRQNASGPITTYAVGEEGGWGW